MNNKIIMDPSSIWIPENTLVLLCGVSNSGKSSFCRKHFSEKLVVCADDILMNMVKSYPDDNYPAINSKVQDYSSNQIVSLGWCYKSTVVIDAIGVTNNRRLATISKFSCCFSGIIQIVIQPDLETILKRSKKHLAPELQKLGLYYPNSDNIINFYNIIQSNIADHSISKGTDQTYILHNVDTVSIIY